MCQIFARQDPVRYACHTRSVRLAGHATSIRLEQRFWEILDDIAAGQDMSTPRFLSRLYEEALEIHGDIGNFASLLRCVCVTFLADPEANMAAARRELATPAPAVSAE